MKTNLFTMAVILAFAGGSVVTMSAAESNAWSRIGVSYRAGFNISADFTGLGGFTSMNSPGEPGRISGTPGTVVRTYDDGFIGIDISGNANGRTTYWGYDDSTAQVVNGMVQMHSSSSPANGVSRDVDDHPQSGLELNYLHPLGGGRHWRWGLEGAFNWMDLCFKDGSTLPVDVVSVTHAFALDGVVPPVAPPTYVGPVDGPGAPQLSDAAVDVGQGPLEGAASINGSRRIDGNLYGFRLGPFTEYAVTRRISVGLGGGLAVGMIDSEFSFADTVSLGALGNQDVRGRSRETEWLYGGYVRGQVNVTVCKSASVFGGLEFQSLGTFDQRAGDARAKLDLSAGLFLTFGVGLSF